MRNGARSRPGAQGLAYRCLVVVLLALGGAACEDLPAAPNIPPTAAFIYNPVAPITAGETPVVFNATGSRDSDGTIASYTWTFGDGVEQTTGDPVTTHVFVDTSARCLEVTYAVLLTVLDDKGEKGTASQQVKVIEAPAPGSTACR
jgi:PKD repeat protein